MREWRGVVGMVALLGVGVAGLFSSPPLAAVGRHTASEAPGIADESKHIQSSPFAPMGWLHDNRETIDPAVGIGGLLAAVALVFVTGRLWTAARELAVSTRELAAAARDQDPDERRR